MCGRMVSREVEWLPGVRKCIRCLALVKRTRRTRRSATCLYLIYNRDAVLSMDVPKLVSPFDSYRNPFLH